MPEFIAAEAPLLREKIADIIQSYPVLRDFGFPSGVSGEDGLVLLHAGAAFHALATIQDVVSAYEKSHSDYAVDIAYSSRLSAPAGTLSTRDTAEKYYRAALVYSPELAEAHFSLARLLWDSGQLAEAVALYRQVTKMNPHARALSQIDLRASAFWHMGEILEIVGSETEALDAYGEAVKLVPSFGASHEKYPMLLRKHGHLEQAIDQFDQAMGCSHRHFGYFLEFCLPPLESQNAPQVPDTHPKSLMRLTSGDQVVFSGGRYYAVPEERYPITAEALAGSEVEEVSFTPYPELSPSKPSGLLFRLRQCWNRRKHDTGEPKRIRVSDAMINLDSAS